MARGSAWSAKSKQGNRFKAPLPTAAAVGTGLQLRGRVDQRLNYMYQQYGLMLPLVTDPTASSADSILVFSQHYGKCFGWNIDFAEFF